MNGITGLTNYYCPGDSISASVLYTNTADTNCLADGSASLVAPANSPVVCLGDAVTLSAGTTIVDAQVETIVHYDQCPDGITYSGNAPVYEVTWTASVGAWSASGTGTTATFTPTNCGSGSVTFTCNYTNQSPCGGTGGSSVGGSFQVDAVTSLTPSAGLWVDDGDNDPNTDTYLVQVGCNSNITVTAADCLGLDASNLPSCWTMSGGTEIDRKNHSVDGNTVGKTEIDVNCGTSYKKVTIIVYQAKFEIDADSGNCANDTGHTWWNLTVQPSDIYPFLIKDDGTPISGYLGTGGYYCDGSTLCCLSDECYGYLLQPDNGYTATCSYWWCISYSDLIGALTYVADLKGTQIYQLCNNSCVTQAMNVSGAAGISIGISGSCISPCDICNYLDSNWYPIPETCSCH